MKLKEETKEALERYKLLPANLKRVVDRGQRMNRSIMSKIDGTVLEEAELIISKKSKLSRAERDFIVVTVLGAFKKIEDYKPEELKVK